MAPALFTVLGATLVAGFVWLSPVGGEQQDLAKSALATVLLVANLYFRHATGDYFDAPAEAMPLLHTWSLSVEEQFYLVWPWLILAVAILARRTGRTPARLCTVLLAGVAIASWLYCVWLTPRNAQSAFYLMPTRAWEFAVGGLVVLLLRLPSTRGRALSTACAGIGAALVLLSFVLLDRASEFPGVLATLPVAGTAMLIFGTEAAPEQPIARWLSLRAMVVTGLLSYSLYLWHWPILSIARTASLGAVGVGTSVLLCFGAFALSWLTFRYIEQPIRSKQMPLMSTRRRTFAAGTSLAVLVLAGSLGLGAWAKYVWPAQEGNAQLAARIAAIRKPFGECRDDPVRELAKGRARACVVGGVGTPNMLIWGDSHAGQLRPVAVGLVARGDYRVLMRFMASCPPVLDFPMLGQPAAERAECEAFSREVFEFTRRSARIQTVVLSARWSSHTHVNSDRHLGDALARTVAALRASGKRVLIVAPNLEFPYDVPSCLARRDEQACNMPLDAVESRRRAAMSMLDAAVEANPGVEVIDPVRYLCNGGVCATSRGNKVLFSDAHHLSVDGATLLVPAFLARLERRSPHG